MSATPASPAAAQRAGWPELPPARHWRRTIGGPLALGLLGLWGVLFAAGIGAGGIMAKLLMAVALGTVGGMLVIVGHDAAHGSLTPWPRANALLARLAFLPSWQTASGWQQAHRKHHAFTNLCGRDAGYPPLSPQAWRALRAPARGVHRAARTLPGLWALYGQVWWQHVIWPREPDAGARLRFRLDSLLVFAFAAAQCALAAAFGAWGGAAAAGEVALLVGLPFVITLWFVSAITLQHHRHPALHWYDDETTWRAARHTEPRTVQLELPPWLASALLRIFDHAAHHADPRWPLAALPLAQRALQAHAPAQVIVVPEPQPWRLAHLRRVLRECQLYDYTERRWLRFSEVPLRAAVATPASPPPTAAQTGRTG
jgi:acyl-lipid omega-6 desaturase (Delta-12 desaturase)